MKKSWWLLLAALSLVCSCAQRIKMQVGNRRLPDRFRNRSGTCSFAKRHGPCGSRPDRNTQNRRQRVFQKWKPRHHAAVRPGNKPPKPAAISSKSPGTKLRAPSVAAATGYRANMYRLDSSVPVETCVMFDSVHYRNGESVLHFFRKAPLGAWVGYNVKVNDSVVTRARNNWAEEIVIPATGEITLSATTESTSSLILNLQPGYHYYIRCGMKYGALVGRPKLEIVEPSVAKAEIEAIQQTAPDPDTEP